MARTVYDAMGGMPVVLALARAWHARVLADPVVAHAFHRPVHPRHDERLAAYWAEQLGGPATFTGSTGAHASVVAVHSGNGPHDEMDARAVACFELALDDAAVPDDDALRATLTLWFTWATQVLNHEYETVESIPADLPMPVWTWDGPPPGPRAPAASSADDHRHDEDQRDRREGEDGHGHPQDPRDRG
ncbi:oxidoreductase [Xylanimonas protaetiae]|uniref:Oxidoreductase n=1 Tax=Xylanimonas protaetiae TaxID=2509457 RepID=A0A4P6F5P2_9MICO|nr:oxidoreductase [Xylanimonas protaetiae]QAY71280.1 oxidoreductase [Xylanimonas protaetiae]